MPAGSKSKFSLRQGQTKALLESYKKLTSVHQSAASHQLVSRCGGHSLREFPRRCLRNWATGVAAPYRQPTAFWQPSHSRGRLERPAQNANVEPVWNLL